MQPSLLQPFCAWELQPHPPRGESSNQSPISRGRHPHHFSLQLFCFTKRSYTCTGSRRNCDFSLVLGHSFVPKHMNCKTSFKACLYALQISSSKISIRSYFMQNFQYFYVILSVINLVWKSKNVLMNMLVE